MIDEFLDFFLGVNAVVQVALSVDINEGRGPAQRHRRTVLFLNGRQIAEIQPLDRFLGILGRPGNIIAVDFTELFQFL